MTNITESKIGIFWVYKNEVMGRAIPVSKGEILVPGIVDSPDTHIHLWEEDSTFSKPFVELQGLEYQEIPRGRVVFDQNRGASIIYMDKGLFCDEVKTSIITFFELSGNKRKWKTDPHYSTYSYL